MRHYDEICKYMESISFDKIEYQRTSNHKMSFYNLSPILPKQEITGNLHFDECVFYACKNNLHTPQLGKPIRVMKERFLRDVAFGIKSDMLKYMQNTAIPYRGIKTMRDKELPKDEEKLKAIINYGVEVLCFSPNVDHKTKEVLIQKIFEKYME